MPKVIFIPGNGGGSTEYEWFPWVKTELEKLGCVVISPGTYPDPIVARMDVWLPYIESFGTDENTILIGWSSGALAAMRYAETHKILGTVLVAPCHTDLGLQRRKVGTMMCLGNGTRSKIIRNGLFSLALPMIRSFP
jgi:pimeloyl-ACP methyl ester carboxylesterase